MLKFDTLSYHELFGFTPSAMAIQRLRGSLHESGIVGIRDVPDYVEKVGDFLAASCAFSALPLEIKSRYAPQRDSGDIHGFEFGAEKYNDQLPDDKKASYYAFVPDYPKNKWPQEVDLKTPYLNLGLLIAEISRKILDIIGLNKEVGLDLEKLEFLGRMLHYHKEGAATNGNPNWAGAHYDHGVFTGLLPAFYFQDGNQVPEPAEAGLFVRPPTGKAFKKVCAKDTSVLLFQVGEFGQLLSNDRIQATEHVVRKSLGGIERFTMALFVDAPATTRCTSTSVLTKDSRYHDHRHTDGSIAYKEWGEASFARYLVK
jgi:isopenicillin N synthase-like dioxygenase